MPLHKDLNEYGEWLEFHNLSGEKFEVSVNDLEKNIAWYDYGLAKEYTRLFEPFFIYSKDRTHFIDLDTYSLVLEKKDDGKLTSPGINVDVKVQVVNTQNMSSAILLFCGTECYPETALWRNNSWIEIYGFKINSKDKFVPTIWKIEIEDMRFTEYSYSKAFNKMPDNYNQKHRLKNIEFEK